jgi:CDP-paratose 2-epimerase
MRHNGRRHSQHVLITGGAGFIGANLAAYLLAHTDERIVIFDNLSRPGVELNLAWLKTLSGAGRLKFIRGDVRDANRIAEAARDACEIYHLAATAPPPGVTLDPKLEFDVNVTGTINVLEAARRAHAAAPVLFTSTAKVYGPLPSVPVVEERTRYRAADPGFHGVAEDTPIDFHCSANCTMAVADQYVRDYARLYNLPTIVLRLGGIAGPNQFGNEGQGWVAHFIYSVLSGRPITVFGDGRQVRDVLHVTDLVTAIYASRAYLGMTAGRVFNVGGGMSRSISVLEMLALIEHICHVRVQSRFEPARPSDQLLYVSDNSLLASCTGWMPRRTLEQTVRDISAFWHANRSQTLATRVGKRSGSISRAA